VPSSSRPIMKFYLSAFGCPRRLRLSGSLQGGGLEPGETIVQGLGREFREELGLERFTVGPLVWRRQHTFSWYPNEVDPVQRICQTEQYHVVHVSRFEPKMADVTELKVLQEFRWWPSASLAHAEEPLTPTSLAQIVARYISSGPPVGPVEMEVMVSPGVPVPGPSRT
jgi:8-oxo-dGTP pyrophosphatase MutT (NUDIX family)